MKKFYVVGDKVSKSLSPFIFNYWFKKYKINGSYGYLEINNKNFNKKIKETLKNKNVYGLNITIPFKQKIIRHLDGLEINAKKINAVNCVSKTHKTKGFNTDWEGYFKTLPKIKNLKKKKIILIGYGGAALAIHYMLKTKGFKNIIIFNRTKKTLYFEKKKSHTLSTNKLSNYIMGAELIINTTPTNPINTKLKKLVSKDTLLSDIVYTPKETGFLKSFPNNKKIYGISMLLEQAILSFNLWFGFKPTLDTGLMKAISKKIK